MQITDNIQLLRTVNRFKIYKNDMVGLFKYAILPTDPFYDIEIGRGYYNVYSSWKLVSKIYQRLTDKLTLPWENDRNVNVLFKIPVDFIELIDSNRGAQIQVLAYEEDNEMNQVGSQIYSKFTPSIFREDFPDASDIITIRFFDEDFTDYGVLNQYNIVYNDNEIFNRRIGEYVRSKYLSKWTKIYNTLIESQYNPLNDYDYVEKIDADNSNKVTYDSKNDTSGSNAFKETTENEGTINDSISAFNSSQFVNTDKSVDNNKRTTQGNANDNHYTDESHKTGTDTTDITRDETYKREGRRTQTPAYMINAELDLRNKQIFYDIIYKDIDHEIVIKIF